jgi:hypothetical protein
VNRPCNPAIKPGLDREPSLAFVFWIDAIAQRAMQDYV